MPRRKNAAKKPQEPGSGLFKGTVSDSNLPPSGYYWDELEAAKGNKDRLSKLLDELETHGYTSSGQIFTAALAAYNETGAPKRRSAKRKGSKEADGPELHVEE